MHPLVGTPLVEGRLVNGQNHVAKGHGGRAHTKAETGEETGEETAAGFEGVVRAA